MSQKYRDEHILLQEIKNGQTEAFEYLFRTYYPRLRGYASRFVNDDEVVRDLLQDCFLRFWEKREMLEPVSLLSLLFVMVRNACLNYLKRLQLVEQESLDYLREQSGCEGLYLLDFGVNPEHRMLYDELQSQVRQVLDSLPNRSREIFVMSRFDGLKNREIAEQLHISTTAVEKHISKALKAFSTFRLLSFLIF